MVKRKVLTTLYGTGTKSAITALHVKVYAYLLPMPCHNDRYAERSSHILPSLLNLDGARNKFLLIIRNSDDIIIA